MSRLMSAFVCCLVVSIGGCDRIKEGAQQAKEKEARVAAASGLAEVQSMLHATEVENANIHCAGVETYTSKLKSKRGLALKAEVDALCGFEVPLAMATEAVEAAEAARRGAADDEVLDACFSGPYKDALITLAKNHANAPDVTALSRRFEAACGDARYPR